MRLKAKNFELSEDTCYQCGQPTKELHVYKKVIGVYRDKRPGKSHPVYSPEINLCLLCWRNEVRAEISLGKRDAVKVLQ